VSEWMLSTNFALAKEWFPGLPTFEDPSYLGAIVERSKTPNGVFGAKVMWPEMDDLRRGTRWNFRLDGPTLRGSDLLPNPHFVRLSRRDKAKQAISFMLALRTDRWHKTRWDQHVPLPWPAKDLKADIADPTKRAAILTDIRASLAEIERRERDWDRFFAEEAIAPFDVVYEGLVAEPERVIADVLRYLGLAMPDGLDFGKPSLLPMSDERNRLLLDAFLAEDGA
jgi:LPS sulfotransferase NodH